MVLRDHTIEWKVHRARPALCLTGEPELCTWADLLHFLHLTFPKCTKKKCIYRFHTEGPVLSNTFISFSLYNNPEISMAIAQMSKVRLRKGIPTVWVHSIGESVVWLQVQVFPVHNIPQRTLPPLQGENTNEKEVHGCCCSGIRAHSFCTFTMCWALCEARPSRSYQLEANSTLFLQIGKLRLIDLK